MKSIKPFPFSLFQFILSMISSNSVIPSLKISTSCCNSSSVILNESSMNISSSSIFVSPFILFVSSVLFCVLLFSKRGQSFLLELGFSLSENNCIQIPIIISSTSNTNPITQISFLSANAPIIIIPIKSIGNAYVIFNAVFI